MRRLLRTVAVLLVTVSLLPIPAAKADLQEMMDEQFTALTNYTGPASFQTTRRAALTGGSVYARVPIMSERLLSLVPPSLDAGCSGIDFFAGSFSFINADQFIALMKATAANAAGYAFQLAMSAMCETCMAAIETLQKKVQELNQYFGNSCQLAQGIVNDTAAAMGFQRGSSASLINTASGVADVFGSWTSADGENPEVKAANADPDAYAAKIQGNLVWRELQRHAVANWFLGGDNALLEVAMNITGTLVVGELQDSPDGGQAPELIRIVPNPDLFRILVEGGEVTIRGCGNGYDADECTELVDKTVEVTGYQPRLRQLLLGDGVDPGLIQRVIANDNGVTTEQESLLAVLPGSTGSLIFRLAQVSQAAAFTFGQEAAPIMAVELAAEACRKLLQATNVTVSTSEHPYAREVQGLVRDAYLGLNTSVAQAQREHGSMNQLLRQYIDLLNVLNPTAAPGWVAESLGRES